MMPISDRIRFSIGFETPPEPLVDVWHCLSQFLREDRLMPTVFEVSQMWGHAPEIQSEKYLKLSAIEVGALIVDRSLKGFKVDSGQLSRAMSFFLTQGRGGERNARLGCSIEANAKTPDDWSKLIETIMMKFETIGAWQFHGRYSFWQRDTHADDRYERRWGIRPPGARIWKEPAKHALDTDTLMIDTSLNPGRYKDLSSEVSFLPTAEMWLGPYFWQYAQCTKEEVLAADFFLEKRDTPNYLYLKCWPQPFTRPDGEQGRMQQRLWKLFFHEDCEWPPGSGTICDEPMYGPPELMPDYKP